MKLRICGYIPKRIRGRKHERVLGSIARTYARELLKDHPRIKTIQVTFARRNFNYNDGMKWIVKGERVEIVIGRRHKHSAGCWLIRHELRHAKQILEGRINRSLERVVFTNRRGLTRTFQSESVKGRYYLMYRCVETGRLFDQSDVPWELEVEADERRWRRKIRRRATKVSKQTADKSK